MSMTVSLGDCVDITGGGTPSRDNPMYWGGPIPWATVKDLTSAVLAKTQESITLDGVKNSATNIIPPGTVITATRMGLGKTAINTVDVAINQDLKALQPKDTLDSRYLLHFLLSKASYLESIGKGATVKGIILEDLKQLQIPLPPLPEQKRIAAILDKADAIRRKRQQAIKLADDLLRATFLDMFGDPGTNPYSFSFELLSELYSNKKPGTKCGPFGSALKKNEYVESGIPVWTMDNIQDSEFIEQGCLFITEEKFFELESYSVDEDDILISRAGTVGKMCIVKPSVKRSVISTNLIRLALDKKRISPTYFVCLMNFFKGKVGRLKTGEDGAYSFMNTGVLNQLSIPLPPIQQQRRYTDIVSKVKQIQNRKGDHSSEIGVLFNSLTQRAFRGEL